MLALRTFGHGLDDLQSLDGDGKSERPETKPRIDASEIESRDGNPPEVSIDECVSLTDFDGLGK